MIKMDLVVGINKEGKAEVFHSHECLEVIANMTVAMVNTMFKDTDLRDTEIIRIQDTDREFKVMSTNESSEVLEEYKALIEPFVQLAHRYVMAVSMMESFKDSALAKLTEGLQQ